MKNKKDKRKIIGLHITDETKPKIIGLHSDNSKIVPMTIDNIEIIIPKQNNKL